MQRLAELPTLVVTQQKEWGEVLTGFETVNRYAISDTEGRGHFTAAEEAGSFLLRNFLKSARPFKIHVIDDQGEAILRIERPFRLFFYEVGIYDAAGTLQGTVKRQFSLLRRRFKVFDTAGQEVYELFGPLLHPWTFHIRKDGMEIGKITKKWSGLLTEAFTDADHFGIVFPETCDLPHRATLLGAVFLIDFAYFERTGDH